MSKSVRQVQVRCAREANPYQEGSHKYRLMQWALEHGEFSKTEFLEAEVQIFDSIEGQTSKMTPDVRGRAWWNEFYNKYKDFVYNEPTA